MEAVGLGVSIASLASLLQTAVDCFNYIYLAKRLDSDLQTRRLQLDSIQLRLSRWGQSIGLGTQEEGERYLDTIDLNSADVKHAAVLLRQIASLFDQARELSQQHANHKADTKVLEIDQNLPAPTKSLHTRIRTICRQRLSNPSVGKKARWVLFSKERLDNLITDVQALVVDLVCLFPAVADRQKELCVEEAQSLHAESALGAFQAVADEWLKEAITNLSSHNGNSHDQFTWNNAEGTKVGVQVVNQSVQGGLSLTF